MKGIHYLFVHPQMKKMLFLSVCLIIVLTSNAQSSSNAYSAWEATVGANRGQFLGTASNINYINDAKFKIGIALRLNTFVAKDKQFSTAPARLTSGVVGPQAMFRPNILENIDTLNVPKIVTHSVNLAVFFEYAIDDNLGVGFDIDLLGFTLGGSQTVNLYEPLEGVSTTTAKPTRFNLLLVSDNDIGTLNSELYGRYIFDNSDFYGKAGVSFYFSEITTDKALWLNNKRFRHKTPLTPLLGVGYLAPTSTF
ncbi:MAG: hypothetical protein COA58_09845 [Bacteroidetes bacterium]|nr:MAG: hypothetical protein COA58_09845 [Bacteroidota bacterium]